MKLLLSRTGLIASLIFSLFIAAGCTSAPDPDLGPRATGAEVTKHVSGNFFAVGKGGTYFATDKTLKIVTPSGTSIATGKWYILGKTVLCQDTTSYWRSSEDGKTKSNSGRFCSELWIYPDGTANGKGILNGNIVGKPFHTVAPVRGFPLQGKFNSLRRSLGV